VQPLDERLALEHLHDEERHPLPLAHVVHRADVGVVEGGGGARLALKPRQSVRVPGQLRRENLDRHLPPEPGVLRTVDLAHAARAKRRQNLVRPETDA
jgi:hypothetical protein